MDGKYVPVGGYINVCTLKCYAVEVKNIDPTKLCAMCAFESTDRCLIQVGRMCRAEHREDKKNVIYVCKLKEQ